MRTSKFAPVDHQVSLFRFLDFTKYVSMLDQRALFFTRADQLADPFEGFSSPGNLPRSSEHSDDRARAPLRRAVFMSCWHANEYESAAMWRIYLKSEEGVALQTSAERLAAAFGSDGDSLQIGAIRYLDYERERVSVQGELDRFFCKRKAFEYEREVRVLWRSSEPEAKTGFYIAADLDRLIERVVISPSAEPWFAELVQSVTERYGFRFPIEHSELASEPCEVEKAG